MRLRGRQVFATLFASAASQSGGGRAAGPPRATRPDETEAFQLTGTIHLLVIAGLHLGIIAGLAGLVFRRLLPRRCGLPATAVFMVAYMLLVDAQPPVVRATVLIVAACRAVYTRPPSGQLQRAGPGRPDRVGRSTRATCSTSGRNFPSCASRADGHGTVVARRRRRKAARLTSRTADRIDMAKVGAMVRSALAAAARSCPNGSRRRSSKLLDSSGPGPFACFGSRARSCGA